VVLSGLGCLTSALDGTVEQEAVMQRQLYDLELVRDCTRSRCLPARPSTRVRSWRAVLSSRCRGWAETDRH
jgi:hypothetical protein